MACYSPASVAGASLKTKVLLHVIRTSILYQGGYLSLGQCSFPHQDMFSMQKYYKRQQLMIKCIECHELLNIIRDNNAPPCRRHRSLSIWILIISAVAFSWIRRRGYKLILHFCSQKNYQAAIWHTSQMRSLQGLVKCRKSHIP